MAGYVPIRRLAYKLTSSRCKRVGHGRHPRPNSELPVLCRDWEGQGQQRRPQGRGEGCPCPPSGDPFAAPNPLPRHLPNPHPMCRTKAAGPFWGPGDGGVADRPAEDRRNGGPGAGGGDDWHGHVRATAAPPFALSLLPNPPPSLYPPRLRRRLAIPNTPRRPSQTTATPRPRRWTRRRIRCRLCHCCRSRLPCLGLGAEGGLVIKSLRKPGIRHVARLGVGETIASAATTQSWTGPEGDYPPKIAPPKSVAAPTVKCTPPIKSPVPSSVAAEEGRGFSVREAEDEA